MTNESIDTRIGRLEGRFESISESLERLHKDDKAFELRQSEMLSKLDTMAAERSSELRNRTTITTLISGAIAAVTTWVLTHWIKA